MQEIQVRQVVAYLQSVGFQGDFWTPDRVDVWCEELRDLDFDATQRACREWARSNSKPPTIADIRNAVLPDTGHPGPEEAWALVPKTEEVSAVVTQQILSAMGVAIPMYVDGDKVGARMAFKEAYGKLLATVKGPPEWTLTRGTDKSGREASLVEAVHQGRLTATRALGFARESLTLGKMAEAERLQLEGSAVPQIEMTDAEREANLERAHALVQQSQDSTKMP